MQDSVLRFDAAAHNLANINTPDFQAKRADGARGDNDAAGQLVDVMTSANTYKLGTAIVNTSNEMLKSLVDIKA